MHISAGDDPFLRRGADGHGVKEEGDHDDGEEEEDDEDAEEERVARATMMRLSLRVAPAAPAGTAQRPVWLLLPQLT